MEKMKEMVTNTGRASVGAIAVISPLLVGTITSYAADAGSGATGALTAACTTIAGDISSAINAVLPIALPLVGAALVVGIGLKVFKRIANKA